MSACHETLKIGVPLPKNGVILALNPKNGPFDNSVLKSLHFKARFSPPCDQRCSDELVLNKLAGSTYNTTPDSDLQCVQVQSERVLSISQENL